MSENDINNNDNDNNLIIFNLFQLSENSSAIGGLTFIVALIQVRVTFAFLMMISCLHFHFLFCFLQDNLANTFTCQVFTFTFVFLNIISLLPTQHSFFSDFLFQKCSPPTFVISDRTLFPQKAVMRINQVYFIFAFNKK